MQNELSDGMAGLPSTNGNGRLHVEDDVTDELTGLFSVGMWKRFTASILEDGIATIICTAKWKRKRKRKRWKRY